MAEFMIVLPEEYSIASRGVGVTVRLPSLSSEIVARLALHGLEQKVGDAAAGALKAAGFEGSSYKSLSDDDRAKVQAKAKPLMQSVVDSLLNGEWSERRAGEQVDPLTARIRVIFGKALRTGDAAAKGMWSAIKSLDPAERGKALDEVLAEQTDEYRAGVKAQAEKELATEAETAKATKGLSIKSDLLAKFKKSAEPEETDEESEDDEETNE